MDFAAALNQTAARPGTPCSVAAVLDTAKTSDEHAQIVAALADPNVTGAHLARAFGVLGHKIASGTIRRHRAGECRCGS